jgi:hypothetical protein
MAERTGLEPATPGVTGRYSNQLNYRSGLGWPLEEGSHEAPAPAVNVSRPQAPLETGRES